ncbi:dipeptidyl peptidase 4-like isoform X2 [Tigriopus californicus]|uniref:dipeptidyl peptidase 4-like isoform X2 n=1 Tax=Tigriopus californicus TaxID=6832 RepID=UPI0027D9E35D|nr:dipeptidyl peptidase 4-like isoform X2 [Tigriopus californicus]
METCPRCRQFKIMCMCSSGDDEKTERERQKKHLHQLEQLKHQQYVLSNASSRSATPNASAIKSADSSRTKVKPLHEDSPSAHPTKSDPSDEKPRSSEVKSPNKVSLNQHLQKQQINAKLLQNGEVELVAATPNQRNWKGIAIALLVIGLVIALVALAVVIVTPPNPGPRIKGERVTLDLIIKDQFKPRHYNGTWVSKSELLFTDEDGGISIMDMATLKSRNFLSNSTFRQLNSRSFRISADLKFVLVPFDSKKKYRHSTLSKYAIVNVNTSSFRVVNLGAADEVPGEPLQLAEWSAKGHALAFVFKNDIYYQRDADDPKTVVRLTDDGQEGTIFNGVTDWLYEEEIFSSNKAIWFSPDGGKLVYASFNDSMVRNFNFIEYGGMSPTSLYPTSNSVRYPKTGTANPQVQLHLVELDSTKTIQVAPPELIRGRDHYLASVEWITDQEFACTWLNRRQNMSVISKYSGPSYTAKEIHREVVPNNLGWIDPSTLTHKFSQNGKRMLFIEAVQEHGAGYYPQLHEKDISRQEPLYVEASSLTHGAFHVTDILGWDEPRHLVYFIANQPGSPGVRHLFQIGDNHFHKEADSPIDMELSPSLQCLTCALKNNSLYTHNDSNPLELNANFSCDFTKVDLSPEKDFYVLNCLGPRVPFSAVISLPNNNPVILLDSNTELEEVLSNTALPVSQDFEVALPGTNVPAQVRLLLPPGLRENEEFIFPLLVNVYGGPGSQDVSSRWRLEWDHFLSSQRDFVVAHIDVRGTGFSGNDFKHAVFRELGRLEVSDTLHVLKFLLNTTSYLDKSKVAVWGWSYGGYLASRLLVEDTSDLIKCTMSVAPVTDWRLYDSAYTERFMGMPEVEDNWKGYENADVSNQANRFLARKSKFFLIHGTSDENVHLQHSMLLTKTLVEQNVQFKQMFYPEETHALKGVVHHLYSTLEHNLDECLGPIPDYFSNMEIQYSGLQQLQELFTFRDLKSS